MTAICEKVELHETSKRTALDTVQDGGKKTLLPVFPCDFYKRCQKKVPPEKTPSEGLGLGLW